MSRVVRLLAGFFDARLMHAPPGSPEDRHLRRALSQLVDAQTLPGPEDRDDLRTPLAVHHARPMAGTDLVLIYEVAADQVRIHAVRPAAW